jgi:hypothetical protein
MALRKWMVRTLVFTVAAGAAAAGLAYKHWTDPAVVREQVVARLEDYLPAAIVSLESSRFRLLGGISLNELRLVRRDDPDHTEFVRVPGGVIYHDKEQLANGKLAIRLIEWDRPTIHVIRRQDGTWNLAGVLAPPDPHVPVPMIVLKRATIVFEDQCQCAGLPPMEFKEVNLSITNDPLPTLLFKGAGVTDLDGPVSIQVNGKLGRVSNEFSASIVLDGLPVNGNLVQRLASFWPDVGVHARQLSGVGKLHADISYQPKANQGSGVRGQESEVGHWGYDVRWQLSRGSFSHAKIPFPLENIEAKGRCVDGQLTVEKITAQSGAARLELSGRASSLQENADMDGNVKIEHLPLTPELFAALPAGMSDCRREYDPQGGASVSSVFQRRGGKWAAECKIHPEDVRAVFEKFPYPLEHVTGTIEHKLDQSSRDKPIDEAKIDLIGYTGSQPVYIQGEVAGAKPARLDFRIWAKNVPLDKKLHQALQPRFQKIADSFSPTGLADVEAFIHREQGKTESANRYVIRFHDATIKYEIFPYPVENVTGTLDIQADQWEFRDFHGSHKGGHFRGHGGSVPTSQGTQVQIEITGSNVLLDEELEGALQRPTLKTAWKKLAPSGRMSFEARVNDIPGQKEPDIAVTLTPLGSGIKPDFFPCALTELRGSVHYQRGDVELSNLRARHGPTVLTLERGKVHLKPEGGLSVDIADLVGNPVLPDAEFLTALPPALGKACTTLQLRDPFSLLAKRLVVDVPAAPEAPPHIYWDGGIRLDKATLRAGVSMEQVSGVIFCRGEHRGAFGKVLGNLQLDQMTLFQQPFHDIHSHIVVNDKEPDFVVFPDLKAHLFGGDVSGSLRMEFAPAVNYQVNLRASQIQLKELGRHNHLGPDTELSGLATAALFLQGKGTELNGLEGNGSLDVDNGKMYKLPLLLDLLKFLNLRWPDRTFFEEAHVRFTIRGPRADISRLDLLGNAISLGGKGAVAFGGSDINYGMDLYAVWGRVVQISPPVIKDIWPALSKQLLKIKMKGRIGDPPRFEKEPVPILVDPVKEFLERIGGKGSQ